MTTLLELTLTVALPCLAIALLLAAAVLSFAIHGMHADEELSPDETTATIPARRTVPTDTFEEPWRAKEQPQPLVVGNGFALTPEGRIYATS